MVLYVCKNLLDLHNISVLIAVIEKREPKIISELTTEVCQPRDTIACIKLM